MLVLLNFSHTPCFHFARHGYGISPLTAVWVHELMKLEMPPLFWLSSRFGFDRLQVWVRSVVNLPFPLFRYCLSAVEIRYFKHFVSLISSVRLLFVLDLGCFILFFSFLLDLFGSLDVAIFLLNVAVLGFDFSLFVSFKLELVGSLIPSPLVGFV